MTSIARSWSQAQDNNAAWQGDLARFRVEFYGCLTARADALFELTDALLCADGPVRSLVELTLVAEHRRGPARCTTRWAKASWNQSGCVERWPRCRYR